MSDPGYSWVGAFGLYIDGDAPRCQMVSPTNFTNRSWAELVLLNLGGPQFVTQNNIDNLLRWMSAENPSTKWWGTGGINNVLNNGLGSGGGAGYGSYADLSAAAYWAAQELQRPIAGFPAIVAALRSDASPAAFSSAVVRSGWACSHYGVKAAGSDDCREPATKGGPPVDRGYWTRPGRGLDYLSTLAVPPVVTASVGHGMNVSGTNGVGWDWVSPQVWRPSDASVPTSEPTMTPDPLMSVDVGKLPINSFASPTPAPPTQPPTGPTGGPPTVAPPTSSPPSSSSPPETPEPPGTSEPSGTDSP
jgi:hypothetical protein